METSKQYVEVQPIEVRGMTFKVYVGRRGHFSAVGADGHTWSEYNETRAAMEADLMHKTKKAAQKVRIPFTRWDGSARNGVATGIHAGTGNLLVEWNDGKKEQITRDYGSSYLPPQDSETVGKLHALLTARNVAQAEYNDYLKSLDTMGRTGLKGIVEAAVLEAMASDKS